MSGIANVTEQSFDVEVMQSELPVLVDLYADWCQPCKALEPILKDVARELDGKLKVVRVDTERQPRLAAAFRVQSIPMLVLIHEGRPVDQVVGLVDKKAIMKMVEPVLPKSVGEVAARELAELITRSRGVPVDIRDAASFARYRIPGAVNVPREQIAARVRELAPTDGRVRVLYSRAQDEAKEAAEQLHAQGVQVGFLAGGFLQWEVEGLDVDRG